MIKQRNCVPFGCKNEYAFSSGGIELKTASAISGMVLFELIKQAGLRVSEIEKITGITEAVLSDPDARIPMGRFLKLWQMAEKATKDPAIGLHLQNHFGTSLMHFVITIAINSRTLLEALQSWARYDRLICDVDYIRVAAKGGCTRITYTNKMPVYENRWIPEQYFSLALEYGRRISGRKITPVDVGFMHDNPGYPKEYHKVFGCPVRFGQKENVLRFDKSDTDLPVISPDPYLKAILVKQADKSLKEMERAGTLISQVEDYILHHLHLGEVNIQAVSNALHMDRSTLYRRLAGEGTSFKDILTMIRKKMAREHLTRGLTASQTAYLLGFTEPSAFQRAFKRWFDVSPGEFKKSVTKIS